jgi:hypothetical protein
MPADLIMKGPVHTVKKSGVVKPYVRSDIVRATMQWKGKTIELPENSISFSSLSDGSILIYHSFYSGEMDGRWYDKNADSIHIKDNTYVWHMDDFEDEDTATYQKRPATFRIVFTPSAIRKLQRFGGEKVIIS